MNATPIPRSSKQNGTGAFTLVELVATIAIVAILTIVISFFTVSYISWARSVSDQRTLLVLNDALNRYKTEGGGTTGLTYGAQISGLFSRMKSVITYGGRGHQVMQSATTYPARSIAATGSGARYHFTRFNTYSLSDYASGDESGNGGGGTHGVQSYTTAGSYTWTVPAGIASVEVLVVGAGGAGGDGDPGDGGGGAGGLVHNAAYAVTPGQSISITVGARGTYGANGTDGQPGTGNDSIFDAIDAIGGGSGGSSELNDGGYSGGSGGGGDGSQGSGGWNTAGQGNTGGTGSITDGGGGGGGGGAGASGGSGGIAFAGIGGDGLQFSIAGTPTWYAGGGGGLFGGTPASGGQGSSGPGGGGTNDVGKDGCVIIKY